MHNPFILKHIFFCKNTHLISKLICSLICTSNCACETHMSTKLSTPIKMQLLKFACNVIMHNLFSLPTCGVSYKNGFCIMCTVGYYITRFGWGYIDSMVFYRIIGGCRSIYFLLYGARLVYFLRIF